MNSADKHAAQEGGIEHISIQHGARQRALNSHSRTAGTGSDDEFRPPVVVAVHAGDARAGQTQAGERREYGANGVPGLAAKGSHLSVEAVALPDDDVGHAAALEVAAGDKDAAGVTGVERGEAVEQRQVRAVEHLYVRAATRAGTADDVGLAVAIDVTRGNPDAAGEFWRISQETL